MTLRLGQVCIDTKRGIYACRRIPHNQNARMSWHLRYRWNEAWAEEVAGAILEQVKPRPKFPLVKPRVVITLRQIREMDYDNMHGAVKPVLDGLKKAGVIEDDSPRHITLRVKQEKVATREEEGVEVSVATS